MYEKDRDIKIGISYEGTPRDYRRTKAIYERWLNSDMNAADFARALNMEYSHVNKMLTGKIKWQEKYLDKVSKVLYCSLEDIDGLTKPCIVAAITYPGVFTYAVISQADSLEEAPQASLPGINKENLYVLRVEDGSFLEHGISLIPGTLLYCAPAGGDELLEGQLVIYIDESGKAHLGSLHYEASGDIVIRKPGAERISRPPTYLRLLDKVVWVKYP